MEQTLIVTVLGTVYVLTVMISYAWTVYVLKWIKRRPSLAAERVIAGSVQLKDPKIIVDTTPDLENKIGVAGLSALFAFLFPAGFYGTYGPITTIDDTVAWSLAILAIGAFFPFMFSRFHLLTDKEALVVAEQGVLGLSVSPTGRANTRFTKWNEFTEIGCSDEEYVKGRFHVFAKTSGMTYKLIGYWTNSESFCERALRNVPRQSFTEKALMLCSRVVAEKNASVTRLPSPEDLREIRRRAMRSALIGWFAFSSAVLVLAYIVLSRNYITGLLGDLAGTATVMVMIFDFTEGARGIWTLHRTKKLRGS